MPRVNGVMTLTDGERSGLDICAQQALAGVDVSASLFDNMLSDIAREITGSLASDGSTILQGNLNLGGNKVTNLGTATAPTDSISLSQVQSLLAALIPAGVVVMTGALAAPAGWLLCNGALVSKNTYATLYSAIAGRFGETGDSFYLPNMKKTFPIGKGDSGAASEVGQSGGSFDHTHTMANHTHTLSHIHSTSALRALIGFSTADSLIAAVRDGGVTFGATGSPNYQTHDVLTGTTGYSLGLSSPIVPSSIVVGSTDGASVETTTGPSSNTTSSNNPPYLTFNFIIKT